MQSPLESKQKPSKLPVPVCLVAWFEWWHPPLFFLRNCPAKSLFLCSWVSLCNTNKIYFWHRPCGFLQKKHGLSSKLYSLPASLLSFWMLIKYNLKFLSQSIFKNYSINVIKNSKRRPQLPWWLYLQFSIIIQNKTIKMSINFSTLGMWFYSPHPPILSSNLHLGTEIAHLSLYVSCSPNSLTCPLAN